MKGPFGGAPAHLGTGAAALVDGQLGQDAYDRAMAHLACCELCRREVAAQRQVKRRLYELSPPSLGDELTRRLLDLPSAQVGGHPRPTPTCAAGQQRAGRDARRPGGPGGPTPRPPRGGRRMRWVLAGAAGVAFAGLAASGAAGSPPPDAVTPSIARAVRTPDPGGEVVVPASPVGTALTVSLVGTGGR